MPALCLLFRKFHKTIVKTCKRQKFVLYIIYPIPHNVNRKRFPAHQIARNAQFLQFVHTLLVLQSDNIRKKGKKMHRVLEIIALKWYNLFTKSLAACAARYLRSCGRRIRRPQPLRSLHSERKDCLVAADAEPARIGLCSELNIFGNNFLKEGFSNVRHQDRKNNQSKG